MAFSTVIKAKNTLSSILLHLFPPYLNLQNCQIIPGFLYVGAY